MFFRRKRRSARRVIPARHFSPRLNLPNWICAFNHVVSAAGQPILCGCGAFGYQPHILKQRQVESHLWPIVPLFRPRSLFNVLTTLGRLVIILHEGEDTDEKFGVSAHFDLH